MQIICIVFLKIQLYLTFYFFIYDFVEAGVGLVICKVQMQKMKQSASGGRFLFERFDNKKIILYFCIRFVRLYVLLIGKQTDVRQGGKY